MNTLERRVTTIISLLFSFRLLGLFIILPVFSPFAEHLPDATPLLVGMALGIYGLTQALFQLPLGVLSDRYPRRHIIAFGFILFIIGSLVAAISPTLIGIIIGRALQGVGAVGSALIALLSDFTRPEKRSKAMAFVGITIGCAFFIAILIAPLLNQWIGIRGIFNVTAVLGAIAIILLYVALPAAPKATTTLSLNQSFKQVLSHPTLLSFDLGIFCLHVILTAVFVVLPLQLISLLRQHSDWQLYLPAMGIAIVLTFALIGWAEYRKKVALLYKTMIGLLLISILAFTYSDQSLLLLGASLTLFFLAFNVLEANLPSLISRVAPPDLKGTATGVYSTCQYLGIFLGGTGGGWLYGVTSSKTVFFACAIMAALWLLTACLVKVAFSHHNNGNQ